MIEIPNRATWNFKSEAETNFKIISKFALLNLHISSSIHKILRINLRKIYPNKNDLISLSALNFISSF